MAKLPYLPGEPHQPVSFPFQNKNVRPEEDSPKVFPTYVHGISRGLCCSTTKKRMLQKIVLSQDFIKLEVPCKAGKQSNGNLQFEAELQ